MKPVPLLVYEWVVPITLAAGVMYELRGRRIPRYLEIATLVGFITFALVLIAVYPAARSRGPSPSDVAIISLLIFLSVRRAGRTLQPGNKESASETGGAA